jgi:hypothetical protein
LNHSIWLLPPATIFTAMPEAAPSARPSRILVD